MSIQPHIQPNELIPRITKEAISALQEQSIKLFDGSLQPPTTLYILLHPEDYQMLERTGTLGLAQQDAMSALEQLMRVRQEGTSKDHVLSKYFGWLYTFFRKIFFENPHYSHKNETFNNFQTTVELHVADDCLVGEPKVGLPNWKEAEQAVPRSDTLKNTATTRSQEEPGYRPSRDNASEGDTSDSDADLHTDSPSEQHTPSSSQSARSDTLNIRSDTLNMAHDDTGRRMSSNSNDTQRKPKDAPSLPTYATLTFTDDKGRKVLSMNKELISIGRAGDQDIVPDIQIQTDWGISKRHIFIEYIKNKHVFKIKDVSRFGTLVNGKAISKSVKDNQDMGLWELLPHKATIELAPDPEKGLEGFLIQFAAVNP